MLNVYAPLLLDQVFSLTEYQTIMITISVGNAQSVTSTNVIAVMKKFIVMKISLLMTFIGLTNLLMNLMMALVEFTTNV